MNGTEPRLSSPLRIQLRRCADDLNRGNGDSPNCEFDIEAERVDGLGGDAANDFLLSFVYYRGDDLYAPKLPIRTTRPASYDRTEQRMREPRVPGTFNRRSGSR